MIGKQVAVILFIYQVTIATVLPEKHDKMQLFTKFKNIL